eukprot:5171338-Prymnesium_polylepis.1
MYFLASSPGLRAVGAAGAPGGPDARRPSLTAGVLRRAGGRNGMHRRLPTIRSLVASGTPHASGRPSPDTGSGCGSCLLSLYALVHAPETFSVGLGGRARARLDSTLLKSRNRPHAGRRRRHNHSPRVA